MKIAIVCYPTFGGSGVVATELGLELARKGHEIHFITYKQPVRLDLLNPNIFFHEVNVPEYALFHYQPYELALSSKIVDTVKLHNIDILHVHYAIPHAFAGYMARKMLLEEGIYLPIVTTLHGTDITLVGKHPYYKTAVTFSINKSDYVTSVSESLKRDTYNFFDVKKEIYVIPNFIDADAKDVTNSSKCCRSNMAKPEEKIITHISNFRGVKRVLDVVEVFNKIQQQTPAKLMMVGEGPDKEKAEELCVKLGIENKVIFFGNTFDVDRILKYSDLFLLPSESESFGLAALEAMACKVPVISSNAGGLSEVNVQGETGFLSNIGDVDDMAKNAMYILSDESRLETFKQKAFDRAKIFNIEAILPMYLDIYEKALANKKPIQ